MSSSNTFLKKRSITLHRAHLHHFFILSLLIYDEARRCNMLMPDNLIAQKRSIPAVDTELPKLIETATFALG